MATAEKFKLTYATMYDPPAELHTRFEEEVAKIKANLGQEYGMIVDGKDLLVDEKFENYSPIDTDMLLGIFQRASAEEASRVMEAARRGAKIWGSTPWQERVALVHKAADHDHAETGTLTIIEHKSEGDPDPYSFFGSGDNGEQCDDVGYLEVCGGLCRE